MTEPSDTLSSEQPAVPSRWRTRETSLAGAGVRTTAMTAALTVVAAAGIATAIARGTTGETSPAALIPASAFAVATADLSLPGGQADALETMLGRFPGVHLTGGGSIRDRILRAILPSDAGASYDADIKPWLGDHVAIAGWDHDGKPQMEVLLQSTDDSSARSHLKALMHGNAFAEIHDGYAVLGSSQASVDAAITAAKQSSLNDGGPYDGDIAALPDNEAITAWFNGPAAKNVLAHSPLAGPMGAMAFGGVGGFGAAMGELFKGRVSLGVHVTDTVAELNVRNVGGTTNGSAPSTMLTTLPGGTIGAFELGDPGAVVDAMAPLVRFFGAFAGGSSSATCTSQLSATPMLAPSAGISRRELRRQLEATVPANQPHRRALIRRILRTRDRALRRLHQAQKGGNGYIPPMPAVPGPKTQCYSQSTPLPTDPFAEIQKAIGIRFPDDVKTVLGDRAVVAFGGLELAGLPDIAIRSHPADLSTAQSLANTMSSQLATSTPLHLDVSTSGDDLVLATSSTYGQEIAKGGDLGDQDQVKTALDGMPASISAAIYVNLSRVWPLVGSGTPDGVQHLHAVGFWAASSGDVQTAQLRVVMG